MKKSNALMLSYIIFLALSFLVDCFFDWGGLGKVAMAATLSGLFFAIADLIGWRVSCEQDFLSTVQKTLAAAILSVDKLKLCSESIIAENKEVVELITLYDGQNDALDNALKTAKAGIVSQEKYIETSVENKSKAEMLSKEILHIKNQKINKLKKAETAVIVFGFVAFFVIATFDGLYTLLLNVESSVTVIAFCVIMVTYFLKDIFVSKKKKELEGVLSDLAESEEVLAKMMEDVTKRKITKEVKELIGSLETQKALECALEKIKSGE